MSVKCPICGKKVKGESQLRFHMQKHPEHIKEEQTNPETGQTEEPEKEHISTKPAQKENKEYRTTTQKVVGFSGRDMNMAEILINSGFAKDFSDLTRKGMHLAAALLQTGNITQKGNEMNTNKESLSTEETMEKLLKQDLLRAQVEGMKNKNTSPIELMMMKEMYGESKKGGSDMSQLMMMQMMQNKGNNGSQSNPQIEQMQQQMVKLQEDKRYDDLKNMILMSQNQNKESPTDMMMKIEQLRGKRESDIEKLRMELETQKNQMFMRELSDIRNQMNQGMEDQGFSKTMRDKVDNMMLKNMEFALNGGKEKSKGEMAADIISNTIEKIREPILAPIGQAMADKMVNQSEPPNQPQQPSQPIQPPQDPRVDFEHQVKPKYDPLADNTGSDDYDDLVNVSTQ